MNRNLYPPRSVCLIVGVAFVLTFLCVYAKAAAQVQAPEDEIVANLAGGRVIVHVARDGNIGFAAINQPVDAGGVPPRVLEVDSTHLAALRGASDGRIARVSNTLRRGRNFP